MHAKGAHACQCACWWGVGDPSAASPLLPIPTQAPMWNSTFVLKFFLYNSQCLFLSLNYRVVETKNCIPSLSFRFAQLLLCSIMYTTKAKEGAWKNEHCTHIHQFQTITLACTTFTYMFLQTTQFWKLVLAKPTLIWCSYECFQCDHAGQ